ncbi:hypothetical protein [Burkholderia anthina]|uniref:hypothetical protein n=1 Tax=Burkholderia anthina TaxID=179879 RepID=UPI00158A7416|nr:hypothetical protein [Burkholderia anthina]
MTEVISKMAPTARKRFRRNRRTPQLSALLHGSVHSAFDPFVLHVYGEMESKSDPLMPARAEVKHTNPLLYSCAERGNVEFRLPTHWAGGGVAYTAATKMRLLAEKVTATLGIANSFRFDVNSGRHDPAVTETATVSDALAAVRAALAVALESYTRDVVAHGFDSVDFFQVVQNPLVQKRLVDGVMQRVESTWIDHVSQERTSWAEYLAHRAPNVVSLPDAVEDAEGRLTPMALKKIQEHANKELQVLKSTEIEPFE